MQIHLQRKESRLTIDTNGAKIVSLILDGHSIVGSFTRGNGKIGRTHPCSPNFGPETETTYGLSPHGPARDNEWEVKKSTDSEATLVYPISQGTYPEGVMVEQRFRLNAHSLTLETTHTNTGTEEAPVNFAEHFYWCTNQGWNDLKVNDIPMADLVRTTGVVSLKPKNHIVIPGLPEIELTQSGLPVAVLWAYENEETGEYDTDYVCLEPAEGPIKSPFFGSPPSLLAPGLSRVCTIKISM